METWQQAIDAFDDFLDSTEAEVVVFGMKFFPAQILKECDPIAYRCSLMDFIDSEGVDSDDLEGVCPL